MAHQIGVRTEKLLEWSESYKEEVARNADEVIQKYLDIMDEYRKRCEELSGVVSMVAMLMAVEKRFGHLKTVRDGMATLPGLADRMVEKIIEKGIKECCQEVFDKIGAEVDFVDFDLEDIEKMQLDVRKLKGTDYKFAWNDHAEG